MFPAVGAVLGSLHPITGGILWRGIKFQACTNILNNFFLTVTGIFGSHLIFLEYGIFFIVPYRKFNHNDLAKSSFI